LFILLLLVALAGGAAAIFLIKRQPATITPQEQAAAEPTTSETPPSTPDPLAQPRIPSLEPTAKPAKAQSSTVNLQPSAQAAPVINPYARQLIASLSGTNLSVGEWKTNLQTLIQQGPSAVSAIREFLDKNVDLDFGPDGKNILGYDSSRRAMFDALQQIGGPEAVSVMTSVLGTTADPKEIAILARNLAQQDPEQYRGEVLAAVHEALQMAANKNLEGSDVGPLFEVLQKYGGPSAVADLEQAAGTWKYYATIALAQLPDGTGVPSLIRMAQDPSLGTRTTAMEMLAQIATQYPQAKQALLDQIRANGIPPNMWPYLTGPLAGDQFQVQDSVDNNTKILNSPNLKTTHVAIGNQNFISAPPPDGMTADQINQQMALIDELLGATSNPAAINALQQSKQLLIQRQQQVAAMPRK
jgi:hypothetical protein